MNSINSHDTKSIYRDLWHFYTLTTAIRKIKRTNPFIIATKRIKYLEINLTKKMKICTLKTIRH